MPRPLLETIRHIRAVAADPTISATLIQTEDLEALCDAAEIAINAGLIYKREDQNNDH